jgi:cell division cycle protein 20 (cofactor of APC complex)
LFAYLLKTVFVATLLCHLLYNAIKKSHTIKMDGLELENMMDLSTSITSTTSTRWERKQKQMLNTSHSSNLSSRSTEFASSSSSAPTSDRFIPHRAGTLDRFNTHALVSGVDENASNKMNVASDDSESNKSRSDNSNDGDSAQSDYNKLLSENSQSIETGTRVLAFKNKAPAPVEGYQNSLKVLYSQKVTKKGDMSKPTRHISSTPARILDAPDLLDDYYLNLLSWGPTNQLAVALSSCVYLWDASTGGIQELMNLDENPDDYVSSVSWLPEGGSHLAIGTNSSVVQLWDVAAGKQVRSMDGHSSRVGSLAWNNHILTSGSRDTTIINHDVRVRNHIVGKMSVHEQEVCGLSWSPDGSYLASGANDNALCIFDLASSTSSMNCQPKHVLREHNAAVKALAWSPHERNLLASGGGTADRCIKFWNAASGTLLNSIDTGSQVCSLQWSPYEKELLSSHGYAENQLCLWKYPTMAKIKELKGHTSRVLHMATSPDGSLVCSGAADETLRFWNVFASEGKKKTDVGSNGNGNALSGASGSLRIR